jgi:ABC-type transport system involved in multi-copper enzyme maturation permease subunit
MSQIRYFFVFSYLRFTQRLPNLLLWSAVWAILLIVFAAMFDSFKDQANEYNALITTLPPALRETFNISSNYVSKPESFLSGQFLTLYILIGSIFSWLAGNHVIAGKIEDQLITTWLSKKLSRSTIYLSQGLVNLMFFWLAGALVWLAMLGLFEILSTSSIDYDYAISGFVLTSILYSTWVFVGHGIGSFIPSKINQGLGIGVIIISFFLNTLSSIKGYPNWLKPFSLFYYIDIPILRDEYRINWEGMWVLPVIAVTFYVAGLIWFRRRDIC